MTNILKKLWVNIKAIFHPQKKVRNYEIDILYKNLERDIKLLNKIKKEYLTGNDMLENTLKIEIEKLKARISDLEH